MILAEFIANNKVIQLSGMDTMELDRVIALTTGSGWSWKTKSRFTISMFDSYRFIDAGLWYELLKLRKEGYNVVFKNMKDFVNPIEREDFDKWLSGYVFKYPEMRPYQVDAAYKLLKFPYSKIEIAPGGGKTFTFFLLCRYILDHNMLGEDGKILLVMPKTLIMQNIREFESFIPNDENSPIRVASVHGKMKTIVEANVVIGNPETLVNKDKEFFEDFGAIFLDEAHKGKTTTVKTILSNKNNERVKFIGGMSGTFYEEGTIEALTLNCYVGSTIMKVTQEELVEGGYIAEARVIMIKLKYTKETSRAYYDTYVHDRKADRYRTELNFLNQDTSRTDFILRLSERMEHNQLFLYISKQACYDHAQYAREHFPNKKVYVITGDVSYEERDEICQELESINDAWIFGVAKTMDTGVSINNLHAFHAVDSGRAFISLRQAIGRTIRLHPSKKQAIVYDWCAVLTKDYARYKSIDNDKENKRTDNTIQMRNSGVGQIEERQRIYRENKYEYVVKVIEEHKFRKQKHPWPVLDNIPKK